MKIQCPSNHDLSLYKIKLRTSWVKKDGVFYRSSDRKKVQRFCCKLCGLHFSVATFSNAYRQKKRHLNHQVSRLLVGCVSQREAHRILKINRKTVVRKFIFMSMQAQARIKRIQKKRAKSVAIQFDDLETFEHTKCKPLSVTLAVEEKTRWILGFEVSQMPAKGHLSRISVKKYGLREDHRTEARKKLLNRVRGFVTEKCLVKSDENPHYVLDVRKIFSESKHIRYKGRQGSVSGQGELKKVGFDPLFDLNHTCATLRARMSRLIRRTWCTTKKPERLTMHLALVMLHHNLNLNSA